MCAKSTVRAAVQNVRRRNTLLFTGSYGQSFTISFGISGYRKGPKRMRCAICDNEDDMITYDRKTQTFSDCRVCQAIVFDTVSTYDEEDELLEEIDGS